MLSYNILSEANGVVLCHLYNKAEFVVWNRDAEGPGFHSGYYSNDIGAAYNNFINRSQLNCICPECGGALEANHFEAKCLRCGMRYSLTLTITSLTPRTRFKLPSHEMCHTPTVLEALLERRFDENLTMRAERLRRDLPDCFPGLSATAAQNLIDRDFVVEGDAVLVYG